MDPIAAAQFANFIARFYQNLAMQVGDYIHEHIGDIPDNQLSILSDDQTRLISYSNTFFALSDSIAFQGADVYFSKVQAATGDISEALKSIEEADTVITIAANVITLAGGIVSRNTGMITSALTGLKGAVKL
jgi:hypothetical protein